MYVHYPDYFEFWSTANIPCIPVMHPHFVQRRDTRQNGMHRLEALLSIFGG